MKSKNQSWAFYFLADLLSVVAAYYATMLLRFRSAWGQEFFTFLNRLLGVRETGELGWGFNVFYSVSAPRIIVILAVSLCLLYALRDLYAGWRFLGRRPVAWNIVAANGLALVVFYAYFYLSRNVFHPRSFFATLIVLNTLFCLGLRALTEAALRAVERRFSAARVRALLIGNDEAAGFIDRYVLTVHPHGIDIVGRIASPGNRPFDDLATEIEQTSTRFAADMLICAEKRLSVAEIMRLLDVADRLDVPVKVLSDKLDVLMHRARLPVDVIHGLPLVHFAAPSSSARFERMRRHASVLLAAAALVVALPAMVLIALLVGLTSPGGVFFIQERIGVDRRPFRMVKFRTMRHKADEMQAELEDINDSGDGLFKVRSDPRVTPVGRFLRRFSLDELPQLLNVLKGDMLLVGPRPLPRRDFENYYEQWHYSRHGGMPGITCLWQVSGRSDIDFHNMCILDVYYLRNRSWALDLRILLRTIWAVLFAKGAY